MLQGFPITIFKSVTNFGFYPEMLRTGRFKSALSYFFTLHLLLGLIIGTGVSYLAVGGIQELVDFFYQEIPDFEFTLTNGELATNLPEPYVILEDLPAPASPAGGQAGETEEEGPSLLAIDTTGTIPDLTTYDSGVLVTKHKLLFKEDQYQTRSFDFQAFENGKISKRQIQDWITQYQTLATVGLVVLIFLATLFLFISGKLVFVIVFSGLGWLASLLLKRGLTYRQTVQLGLYAITPVSLVDAAVFFTPFLIPGYLRLLLFLVFLIGPLWMMEKKEEQPVSSSE